jgi:hypothetical protein
LTGYKAEDNREYYLRSALLAGFFALLASHRSIYQSMDLEILSKADIEAEIFTT